ncbi:hypothetical protein [Bilophila wadsworthia]|uniref:hypothetical protein n=1 Tax=Bilophila wadsworthia TaxID=35833 RepID=UPI0012DDA26B|nr:hypothetical protein [Bilophila wadsworthia]
MDRPIDFGAMTTAQEAAFDRKAEAWCRGHRPCPSGRDPRFWNRRDRPGAMDAYRNGYDRIRWGTPDTNDTGRTDSSPAQSLSDASAVMDAPNHSPAQA